MDMRVSYKHNTSQVLLIRRRIKQCPTKRW